MQIRSEIQEIREIPLNYDISLKQLLSIYVVFAERLLNFAVKKIGGTQKELQKNCGGTKEKLRKNSRDTHKMIRRHP